MQSAPDIWHDAQGSRPTSDVNCGPEPCQRGPALTLPVSYLYLSRLYMYRSPRARCMSCHTDHMQRVMTITLHVKHYLALSSLK